MKRIVADVLFRSIAVLRRLVRTAPVTVCLVLATLCLAAPSFGDSVELDSPPCGEAQEVEVDNSESPDAWDEVTAHTEIVVAPAAISELTHFATLGGERSGFRSRVPRPSGR
jgi:hypothetical protein